MLGGEPCLRRYLAHRHGIGRGGCLPKREPATVLDPDRDRPGASPRARHERSRAQNADGCNRRSLPEPACGGGSETSETALVCTAGDSLTLQLRLELLLVCC